MQGSKFTIFVCYAELSIEHGAPVLGVAFSTDGIFFASTCEDGRMFLFRRGDRLQDISIEQEILYNAPVSCVAFSPDSLSFATGGADGILRSHRTAEPEALHCITT
jgi:WD40 repeat protein